MTYILVVIDTGTEYYQHYSGIRYIDHFYSKEKAYDFLRNKKEKEESVNSRFKFDILEIPE